MWEETVGTIKRQWQHWVQDIKQRLNKIKETT